jgi:hypothetical protein
VTQLDAMQQTAILPASRPFAVGRAGYGYFADAQHYGSLAGRILAGLQQGGRIALVTGDPPTNPLSLATALTEAAAGKHTVLTIACGGEFKEENEQLRRAAGTSPLLLFHQADRLSDGQLEKLCSYLASGGDRPAGVILGRAGFVLRLENLQPSLFKDGRAMRFDLYELGRDEIDAFIRRQLRASKAAGGFAADEINWIADLSNGDPVQVNRLSRLMLELAGGVGAMRGDSTPQRASPRSASRWRRPAPIGVLLCLGVGVLLILAGGLEFGGRIDARVENSGDSSPVPEQAAASPPAVVVARSSAETAAPAEPVAVPSSAETAAPAEPVAAPSSAETAAPAEPVAAPSSAETAAPAEPVATPSSAETAAPAEPVTALSSAETAAPAEPVATPPSAETAARAEPLTAPPSAETAAPAEPVAPPSSAKTAVPADPVAAPPSPEIAASAELIAAPPFPEIAVSAEPIAVPPSAETAAPAEPVAPPAETALQGVSVAATGDKASTPLPAKQITALLAQGDEFVRTRDIASARLLYERAADTGNGRAALRMGESFDPAFLDRIGIYRMAGDRQLALSWYRRARDLGDAEAAQLLEKLESR